MRIKRSAFLPSAHPLIAERGFMHNMHCFIFGPTARRAAFRRPRRQAGCTATPARPGKAPTGPKKAALGALARDAMQKSRQRIGFLGARAVAGMGTAPAAPLSPRRGLSCPSMKIRSFGGTFAPGRAGRGTSHGASGRASQSIVHKLDECAHKLAEFPEMTTFGKFVRALVKIMHPSTSTQPSLSASERCAPTMYPVPDPRATRCAIRLRPTPRPHTQNIPGRKQKRAGSATHCRPSMAGDNPRPMTTTS